MTTARFSWTHALIMAIMTAGFFHTVSCFPQDVGSAVFERPRNPYKPGKTPKKVLPDVLPGDAVPRPKKISRPSTSYCYAIERYDRHDVFLNVRVYDGWDCTSIDPLMELLEDYTVVRPSFVKSEETVVDERGLATCEVQFAVEGLLNLELVSNILECNGLHKRKGIGKLAQQCVSVPTSLSFTKC